MEGASFAAGGVPAPAAATEQPQLKAGAISFISNIVISVASVAPAYSLAATLGFIAAVGGIGLQSPAIMLVAFIPMACIAAAYYYMNRADPDCGTTFTWMTRAMGPHLGWTGGWAIIVADVLVMPSLAQVAGNYTYQLVGWTHGENSVFWVTFAGIVWIVIMTAICYRGIELSAKTQQFLLGMEFATLVLFAVVALVKVYTQHPAGSITPQFSWFNPFAISSTTALVGGVLLGVFVYWGWDSGVAVNEESEDSRHGPGRAAIISTVVLLLIYVVVTAAAQAYGGVDSLIKNPDDVFAPLGAGVLGSGLDKLLIIAVLTSASASTQTTILPTARTSLSMARSEAIPGAFAKIHPRYLSPSVSTLAMGGVSALVYIGLAITSPDNLIPDAFTSLALTIAFYYGFTGFACVIYYRRELFKSWKNFLFIGFLPFAGGVMLTYVMIKAIVVYSAKDGGYAKPLLGIGSPIAIALVTVIVGLILMVAQNIHAPAFFKRRPEVADPALLAAEEARS